MTQNSFKIICKLSLSIQLWSQRYRSDSTLWLRPIYAWQSCENFRWILGNVIQFCCSSTIFYFLNLIAPAIKRTWVSSSYLTFISLKLDSDSYIHITCFTHVKQIVVLWNFDGWKKYLTGPSRPRWRVISNWVQFRNPYCSKLSN